METLYLVRCRIDNIDEDQYGVDVDYNLIFATTDKLKAQQALEQAESEITTHDNAIEDGIAAKVQKARERAEFAHRLFDEEKARTKIVQDEDFWRKRISLDILEVELERFYPISGQKSPFLGGVSYTE